MIVGISGFGYTGSGAVKDYLSEFDDISFTKEEFHFLSGVDGLADLARSINNPINRTGSSIAAIRRFISFAKRIGKSFCKTYKVKKKDFKSALNSFINEITIVSWKDFEIKDGIINHIFIDEFLSQRVVPHLERKLKKQISFYPMKTVRLSGPICGFYDAAKTYLNQLFEFMGFAKNKLIVLDQAFSANNPQECFPFFDDCKVIVVDKDPRDLYVFAREMLAGYDHFMPINDVESFVEYYKTIREQQNYKNPSEKILLLKFEDLIYNYDESTEKIRCFLNLPENRNSFTLFDPTISVGNTQLFKKYPQYEKDIKFIETQLRDYLYDFESVKINNSDSKMFI